MKGNQSNKGEKGEQGPPGADGPQGPPGLPGLPTSAPTTAPTTVTPGQCGGPGWRRVVLFNMTNTSHICPTGLRLTTYSKRTCGRATSGGRRCWSTTFSVGDSQYRWVCGRAQAYRVGGSWAFHEYHYTSRQGIDGYYVDGLSLTHGAPGSCQHIWTFASGFFTGNDSQHLGIEQCPCDNNNRYPSPPFVGNDYFCESVLAQRNWQNILYSNAPLWDGQVCEGGGRCCHLNNPPWFTKSLNSSTTDGIELRLCLGGSSSQSDIALELLELYVH